MSLSVSEFSVRYPGIEREAIRNLSFKVDKGERVGIIGPAGSGKTTLSYSLLKIIPEYIKATVKGEIVLDGLKVSEYDTGRLAHHVGVVFSDPNFASVALTVEDDVAFGPQCLGLETEEIHRRVDEALEATRCTILRERSITTLSGGELQSAAIAAILAMRQPILVLDEPICNLDPLGKKIVLNIMRDISKKYGTTIIITEAGGDIEYIAPMVDRLLVMLNGVLLRDADTRKVLEDQELMKKIRIEPPQVTKLLSLLEAPSPLPLTIEEAIPALKKNLRKKRIKRAKVAKKKGKVEKYAGKRPIISVRNLHHVFPGLHPVHALKGVSFDIYPGEFIGLIGQNGSGKTTLSLHLVGLLKPTYEDGREKIPEDTQIVIDGTNITDLMRSKKYELYNFIDRINYVFQNPDNQIFEETIEEEVAYGPRHIGLEEDEVEKRVTESLKLYDLLDDRKKDLLYLTKDLKTYTTAASIIAMQPKIIIVDEPTTGLDYEKGEKVMSVLKSLQAKGMTVIVITHNMNLVAKYAERCIVLSDGRIVIDGTPREVFSRTEILSKIFLEPPQITQLAQKLPDLGIPPDILTVDEMLSLIRKNI